MLFEPLKYFYTFVRPGALQNSNLMIILTCIPIIYFFSGAKIDYRQWQMTLSLFSFGSIVLGVTVDLVQATKDDMILPFIFTLFGGGWIVYICRAYFKKYVAPAID